MDLIAYGTAATGGGLLTPVSPSVLAASSVVGTEATFPVAGVAGVPRDAASVLLSIENSNRFSVYPSDSRRSGVAIRGGSALVPTRLSATGDITVDNASGGLRVTVVGYTTAGPVSEGALVPSLATPVFPEGSPSFSVRPGETATIPITGKWGVPAQGVSGALVWVKNSLGGHEFPRAGLDLQVHPSGRVAGPGEVLSWPGSAGSIVRVGADGAIAVTASDQTAGTYTPGQVVLLAYVVGAAPSTPLRVAPRPLAPASVGKRYVSAPLVTTDTRLVTSTLRGQLPPGLAIVDDTLSGVPTTAGDYRFSIELTDAAGHTRRVGQDLTVAPADLDGSAVQVATSVGGSCALTATRRVYCWGSWLEPQIGRIFIRDTIADTSLRARQVTGFPEPVTRIAVTAFGGCAVGLSKQLHCWDQSWAVAPVRELTEKYSDVVPAGPRSLCGTTSSGALKCFGYFGLSFVKNVVDAGPITVLGGPCGAASPTSRTLVCWGDGRRGVTSSTRLPGSLTGPIDAIRGSCVLASGTVQCLEDGVWVLRATDAASLSESGECAITATGTATCWGPSTEPLPAVLAGLPVAELQAASYDPYRTLAGGVACARTVGGAVWCAGNNALGALGSGSYVTPPGAVHVTGLR